MQLAGEIRNIVACAKSFQRRDFEKKCRFDCAFEGVDVENNVSLSVFFERRDVENIVALTVPLKGEAVRDGQFLVNEGESMKVSSTSF